MADEEKKESKEKDDLLATARERFKLAEEAFHETRRLAREDLNFKAGIQWDEKMRADRELTHRPCLTINRIPQYTRQITNDQRQNRPAIRVLPVDDGADIETAKVFQGIIRHIEYNSNAESAYDHAFEGAVDKGFGFFRIATDYISPKSFLQEALIKRIPNHFAVLLDPFSRSPDGSDANWAFVFEDVQKDDFEASNKDAKICKADNWSQENELFPDWVKKDSVRVAEYFYKDFKDEELILWEASTGDSGTATSSEFEDLQTNNPTIIFKEVDKRKTKTAIVKWVKFVGDEILEETIFPSQWIPIIPVYGTEAEIDGKRIYEGVIRHVKDPQRMYNFSTSSKAENLGLAPKAPFIAAEGQIEGYENYWQSANTMPYSVLPYKPVALGGSLVPPPQRNSFEPPIQAIDSMLLQTVEDFKATTGMYDAGIGKQSNETSGIAIQRRASQAQTSNYHYVDNLNISIKHTGRILLEIIPVIYDTEREQQVLGEDGKAETIFVNRPFEQKGKQVTYDLSKGKYDCVVEAGPGYATKRQEAVASMLEFISVYPQAAAILGDILANNMDWPQAQEIAERIRKTIPPHILGDENQEIPPQAQAQLSQMQQMIQMLTGQLQEAQAKIQNKTVETQSKERIEYSKMDVDLRKAMLSANAPMAQDIVRAEIANIGQREELLGVNQPFAQPNFNVAGPQGQPTFQQPQPTGGQPGTTMGV